MRDSLLIGFLARIPWIGPRVIYRLQRAGHGFPTTDWPTLAQRATRLRPATISVDVFDTCVVRVLAGDSAIERVIDKRVPTADRSGPGSSATAEGQPISRTETAAGVERALCRPVPGAAEALAAIRESGISVIFVSDTDRSSESLEDILRAVGIFVEGDELIASCEAGATKSDGTLLPKLFGSIQRSKRRRSVWHAGNHPWADVAMAASAGLTPMPMFSADVNRYEEAMLQRPTLYGPAIAASARSARLSIDHDRRSGLIDAREAAVQTLGADVAGQTMGAFVLWVADQCRNEEIDHVGFLSRDGELPLEMAKAIPPDHWDGRSLHYIQSSRYTWALAAASPLGIEHWLETGTSDDGGFLHSKRHHVTFDALLARVGLDRSDLESTPAHRWLAGLDPNKPLPEEAVEDWEALLADPEMHGTFQARADERLKLIVDRLRADDLPPGKYALVDVGWRGRLATQVSAVLSQVVGEQPVHFHFGGDKVLPDADRSVPIRRFAFDGYSDPHPIDAPVSCIETITASGKPRVVEYRRQPDGAVEMIFEQPLGDPDGDRQELWAGAIRTARSIPARASLTDWGLGADSLADEAIAVLDHWWNRPTRQEVEALADLTFEHDEAGTALRPLVTPYRLEDLGANRRSARRQWPQGSMTASGAIMAAAVRLSKLIRRSNHS